MCYLPFGVGPRHCVATKFAVMEVRMGVLAVMRHTKFVKAPETEVILISLPVYYLSTLNSFCTIINVNTHDLMLQHSFIIQSSVLERLCNRAHSKKGDGINKRGSSLLFRRALLHYL